jgi:hypothetical protein
MSALDWLQGDEGSLDSVVLMTLCSVGEETDPPFPDLGPSPNDSDRIRAD